GLDSAAFARPRGHAGQEVGQGRVDLLPAIGGKARKSCSERHVSIISGEETGRQSRSSLRELAARPRCIHYPHHSDLLASTVVPRSIVGAQTYNCFLAGREEPTRGHGATSFLSGILFSRA